LADVRLDNLAQQIISVCKSRFELWAYSSLVYAILAQLVNGANIEGDKSTVTALKAAVSWQN
jgi:hypothetical protein